MPTRKTHFLVGAVTGLLCYSYLKGQRNEKVTPGEALAVGLFSGGAAILPDVIEPPTGPNHRGLSHSATVTAVAVPKAWKAVEEKPDITRTQKDFLQSILLAFASHNLLDSTTSAGLPLLRGGD